MALICKVSVKCEYGGIQYTGNQRKRPIHEAQPRASILKQKLPSLPMDFALNPKDIYYPTYSAHEIGKGIKSQAVLNQRYGFHKGV